MTELLAPKSAKKPRGEGKPFKTGYDPRRWLKGKGVKSPEQREGEQILLAVIWEELSREFDAQNGLKPLDAAETVDALRLMVRTAIKKDAKSIMERIAGKVTEKVEHTGKDGKDLVPEQMTPSEILARADALRKQIKNADNG